MSSTEIVMSLLFVLSNVFWAFITHKLLNKIMSRTFWEYKESQVMPKARAKTVEEALKEIKVPPTNQNELDTLDEMISKVMPL